MSLGVQFFGIHFQDTSFMCVRVMCEPEKYTKTQSVCSAFVFRKMFQHVTGDHRRVEEEISKRWWKTMLDMEEAKKQLLLSLPMILTNVFYYLITLISVMFAGHLGEHQLASATLANSWATVTGFAFMVRYLIAF